MALSAGVERARRDLGCEVSIYGSGWDPGLLAELFQQQMAGVPDGICLYGDPDEERFSSIISDAIQEGITVTSYNQPFKKLQGYHVAHGFGYAGPDYYQAGGKLIAAAVEKHGLAPGSRIALLHDPATDDPEGLYGGALAAIQDAQLEADSIEVHLANPESVATQLRTQLAERISTNDLPALICSLGPPLDSCLHALSAESLSRESLPLIGLGVEPYAYDLLKQPGSNLSLVLTQDLPLQAYLAVLQVCITREYGAIGTSITTPFKIVGIEDLDKPTEADTGLFVQRY